MFSPHNVLFECRWHFSNYLLIVFLILFSISLPVIIFLPWSVEWKVLLIILFVLYSINILFKFVLFKMPSSYCALRKVSDDWFVYSLSEKWQLIKLSEHGCVVLSWVVILRFCVENNRHQKTLCLLADSLSANDFRRLKVYLRYGR